MKNKDKSRLKILLAASVIFIIAMQGGYLTGFGINPITFAGIPLIPQIGSDMVAFKVSVAEENDLSHTASDVAIYAYADSNGAPGELIQSVTASSGIATFTTQVLEGSYVWLQARQAAPGSETHFISPPTKYLVQFGDPTDTVSLKNAVTGSSYLWVDECGDTAPTLLAMNSSYYAVNTTANFEVKTAETTLNFRLTYSSSDADEVFGYPADFKDLVTGESYLGGIWLVLKCNNSAPFSGYSYTFADQSYTYYVFDMGSTMQDISGTTTGDLTVINLAVSLVSGGDWGNDIQIVADVYQCLLQINGDIESSACFVATHSIDVTAETFDVNN
jgi:hypothetical protein